MGTTIVRLSHISKSYQGHEVLKDLHLEIRQGDFIAVSGRSGCGKSTLLNILGLLEAPDQGTTEIFGVTNVRPFSARAQRLLRTKIAYLFQNYALLENKSILYNLELVFDWKVKKKERMARMEEALKTVGLYEMRDKKACQCSGGEQQRIALARILLKPCDLILADEPTGNLDEQNKELVFSLLNELNRQGKAILMVTHDLSLARRCPRRLWLENGNLHTDEVLDAVSGSIGKGMVHTDQEQRICTF